MTSTDELERLLAEHNANMARIQAARDEGYRLPTEDEWKMRDTQDRLRSAAVNALPELVALRKAYEAATALLLRDYKGSLYSLDIREDLDQAFACVPGGFKHRAALNQEGGQ